MSHRKSRRVRDASCGTMISALLLGTCPTVTPVEYPPTRVIIENVYNLAESEIEGEVTAPPYPVPIPHTDFSQPYTAVLTGHPFSNEPYPIQLVFVRFFPNWGPWPESCPIAQCGNWTSEANFS